MKIISEKTGLEYATVDECVAAEEAYEKELAEKKAAEEKALAEAKAKEEALAATRKERAKEVEDAFKAILEAQKHYNEVKDNFLKDYGSFHMTVKTGDGNPFDFFNSFFDRFWL